MKSTMAPGFLTVIAVTVLTTVLAAGCASARKNPEGTLANSTTSKPNAQFYCVQNTGSRIKMTEGRCVGPGRVYTREELEQTGAFTSAEALKKLDPRL